MKAANKKDRQKDQLKDQLRDQLRQAIEILESSAHRLTKSRKQLLNLIFEQKAPFSAPQLAKELSRKSLNKSTCDPVTVYRSLPLFEELGIIEKCDFSDEKACYEVSLGHGGHHHHHLVCSSCKKIKSLDFCVLEGHDQILKKMGYTQITHRLEFTGLCPSCS